jgi:glycerophosphoryl diester phosphodiesterase
MPRLRTLVALLAASLVLVSSPSSTSSDVVGDPAFPPAPWALAHRGASGVLPEHTVGAYQLAVDAVSVILKGCLRLPPDGMRGEEEGMR